MMTSGKEVEAPSPKTIFLFVGAVGLLLVGAIALFNLTKKSPKTPSLSTDEIVSKITEGSKEPWRDEVNKLGKEIRETIEFGKKLRKEIYKRAEEEDGRLKAKYSGEDYEDASGEMYKRVRRAVVELKEKEVAYILSASKKIASLRDHYPRDEKLKNKCFSLARLLKDFPDD